MSQLFREALLPFFPWKRHSKRKFKYDRKENTASSSSCPSVLVELSAFESECQGVIADPQRFVQQVKKLLIEPTVTIFVLPTFKCCNVCCWITMTTNFFFFFALLKTALVKCLASLKRRFPPVNDVKCLTNAVKVPLFDFRVEVRFKMKCSKSQVSLTKYNVAFYTGGPHLDKSNGE